MELKLNRIQKIAAVMKIITKVIYIISIVASVLLLIGVISYRFFGGSTLIINNVEIHGLLDVTEGKGTNEVTSEMAAAFLECIVSVIIFRKAYLYLKHEIEAGTPFTEAGAKEIKTLGIFCCALTVCASLISAIISVLLKADVEFNGEASIISGIILIFLSFIFSYGAEFVKKDKE